ncbi:AT-hook motif nuclear-localized protein 8 [Euphorbia peplus]|nr:AT-hook motif nuclear-localized protein 8 [Euphorbia peplus]
MDSRDSQPPPGHPQHIAAHQQPHHHHHLQSNMMIGGGAAPNFNSAAHSINMMNPNMPPSGGGFPFNSVAPPRQQQQQVKAPSSDGGFDGSPPSSSGMRFSMDPAKKKRGRPRKYTPDGNIALGLSPTPISSSGNSLAHADSGSGTPGEGSDPPTKRNRGRPPGSGKKQLDALGLGGVGFTPHVITVKAGEDIASKIMAFSQQGPRTVCILSATGAICNVTLRQPATSGGTVTYEGRFEIISLSGSFLLSDNNGGRSRTGGLSVSLAGSDGRVVGGGVAGMLMAASPVQVIVGSFIADAKKSNSSASKSGPSSAPTSQMLNFGAPLTSSPPQGASSESSEENGSSPLNRDPGIYSNANQLHGMNMYPQLWAPQNPH